MTIPELEQFALASHRRGDSWQEFARRHWRQFPHHRSKAFDPVMSRLMLLVERGEGAMSDVKSGVATPTTRRETATVGRGVARTVAGDPPKHTTSGGRVNDPRETVNGRF